MQTREAIFQELQTLLSSMFDIDPAGITLTASLDTDLDIDSIDVVDLMVKLRETTGRRLQAEHFKDARTVQDVVDIVHEIYNA